MLSYDYFFRVTYPDTDRMGTMHHANFVRRCEEARWELLRSIDVPYSRLEDEGVMCPVLNMHFTYMKTTHYDELLRIETHLVKVKGVRMWFEYKMYNENNDLICTANTELAFVDVLSWKPTKIPRKLMDMIVLNQQVN